MPTGIVKTWIEDRGFGFIAPDEGGADVFCHAKNLNGCSELIPGAAVEYDAQFDRECGVGESPPLPSLAHRVTPFRIAR